MKKRVARGVLGVSMVFSGFIVTASPAGACTEPEGPPPSIGCTYQAICQINQRVCNRLP